jgi:hypothetical protein
MKAEANVSNCESARCGEIHLHFCRVLRGGADISTLAGEARELEAFCLARTNLAAWKVMTSQLELAQMAMRSESRAEAPVKLVEHSERRDLWESLVQGKLRR